MFPLHPPDVSFRGAKRRGNLGKALASNTSHNENGMHRLRLERRSATAVGSYRFLRTFADRTMPPDLSLRGPNGAVAISGRQLRFRRSLPVIHHCTARFPRRFAPRNDTSGEREVHQRPYAVKWACTWRSLTAATDAIGLCVLSIPNTNRRCTTGRRGRRPPPRPTGGFA